MLRQLLPGKTLQKALDQAKPNRNNLSESGWYDVKIKVKVNNPITDYHIDLIPTSAPPPRP